MADRDVKPGPAQGPTPKGAAPLGAPNSPTGPNETADGIIKHPAPEGPGEDQPHLLGGSPTESLASTPPLEAEAKPAPKAEPKK